MDRHEAQNLSDLLAEYLAAAEAGGADSDGRLAQRPQDEAVLRELMPLAQELRQMPAPAPSAAFRARGYRSLMREIERQPNWRWQLRQILQSLAAMFAGRGPKLAPAWVCMFAVIILCLSVSGVVLAAEGALPGDPLYGLKTTVEDVRLAVTPTEGDVGLHARFAERRLDEIEALVAAGRLADVPRAAAEYETHVGRALAALASAGETDASARERLATQLDRMLAEQSAELDALAGQMPAQMAPVIQQARAASTDVQNAIRQLRTEPGTDGTTGDSTATPTPEPTATPTADAPQTERPRPGDQATGVPTETPTPTPIRPLPDDTRPAPPADRRGEPRSTSGQPPPVTPGTPGAEPIHQDTPVAANTPVTPPTPSDGTPPGPPLARTPAPETQTVSTSAPPLPAGSPPPPSGAGTLPVAGTPAPPAETRAANASAAPPPPAGSPPAPSPVDTPPAHSGSLARPPAGNTAR
jgi:hypothetical protein